MYLVANSNYQDLNRVEINRLLRDVKILQPDEGTGKTYAKLKVRLQKAVSKQKPPSRKNFNLEAIGLKDRHLWLISTALRYRLTIVSSDQIFSNEKVREVAKYKLENWINPGIEDLENESQLENTV